SVVPAESVSDPASPLLDDALSHVVLALAVCFFDCHFPSPCQSGLKRTTLRLARRPETLQACGIESRRCRRLPIAVETSFGPRLARRRRPLVRSPRQYGPAGTPASRLRRCGRPFA